MLLPAKMFLDPSKKRFVSEYLIYFDDHSKVNLESL